MANQWFQFKQFKVHQDGCAMKVGTDGVLLGAWAGVEGVASVLDIGTGTGLIALMIAQRNPFALIDAIDIDLSAAEQAMVNFEESHWGDRLQSVNASLNDWCEACGKTYDLIVCNPPFFTNSLKSPGEARSLARHSDSMPPGELACCVAQMLSEYGRFVLILPVDEFGLIQAVMDKLGFFMTRQLNVFPTPNKPVKRVLSEWSRIKTSCVTNNLIVEDKGRHGYSDAYIALTLDFYLNSQK